MKPLSQISPQLRSFRGEEPLIGARLNHPVTDCHYHAAAADLHAANGRLNFSRPLQAPSFRDLSNEFLAMEMKRNYIAEAAFFAIIVGVSAWPIVTMFRALSVLMK